MIVETEAIVLNSMKYGDSSKIVSLFTRSFGKVSVLAKGSRKSRNKFGSSLDPLSYSSVCYYNKPNNDLKVLANSELFIPLRRISESFEHLSTGLIVAEAISQTLDNNEVNEELFILASNILIELNKNNPNPYNLALYFQLHFASILGFAIDLKTLQGSDKEIFFSFPDGCFRQVISSLNSGYKFEFNVAEKLTEINQTNFNLLSEIYCTKRCIAQLNDFFVRYFSYHLDKKFSYRTLNLFKSIL